MEHFGVQARPLAHSDNPFYAFLFIGKLRILMLGVRVFVSWGDLSLRSEVSTQMSESQSFCSAISAFFLGTSLGGPALPLLFNEDGEAALRTFLRNGLVP